MAKAKTDTLRLRLQRLYHGSDRRAVRFRYALLTFDIGTIAFFIVSSMVPHEGS